MRQHYRIPAWKTAPFARLLLPFIAGIILQWYLEPSLNFILAASGSLYLFFFIIYWLPVSLKYKLRKLQGSLLQCIICAWGLLLTWQADMQHDPKWFGHVYKDSIQLIIKINEPPVVKERSVKAEGVIESIIVAGQMIKVKGKLILYIDSAAAKLHYGDRIILQKPLQRIRNTGNPGAFNYKRYAAFQGIFHTVYLQKNDFIVLGEKEIQPFNRFIYSARESIIAVLQKYLSKDKNTIGIAEALLIGYKEDLDKDLVQAYSNAGVVHIIAISGLHLGLIYWMLSWIMCRLPFLKKHSLLKVILILGSLWLFAILTGSSASVLRSAVMFSCILLGTTYFRQSSIYNSLAASAFILLCYNPYFLWDVGFQLSYLAVIGIVWLQQPVYRLLYIKQKWVNKIWEMAAVTIAAQLTAFPLCIFYFHQFPNIFLLTNLIAVPLSTVILFAEIFLLCFSWITPVAIFAGKAISLFIEWMNFIIKSCNAIPWAVWDGIYANVITTWLLYAIVFSLSGWLLWRNKAFFKTGMVCLLAFVSLQAYESVSRHSTRKIIIYNISRSQAVDFVSSDKYYFIGDSILKKPGQLQNFHLKPARTAMQLDESHEMPAGLSKSGDVWLFFGRRLMIIESNVRYEALPDKVPVDILLISKNPSLKIAGIIAAIKPSIIVFDSSNSLWKIAEWKKECSALLLPFHSVPEQGAFVFDIK